ncbi:MAG TPA: UDP-N-acetylmuramoyl-tripeptide--D-alanyl-D-alanine ligase [Clostridiaceae bacterium]|nr:UDP-N-acetylmuramoyl-tripeptide--D-alanyl-D-alanine ligase [Clostridiaceae bacterium]
MQTLKCSEIMDAVGGTFLSGNSETVITGVSTDSRTISAGNLFIPIAGARFDGHDFIGQAFERGAAACLTHKEDIPDVSGTVIKVSDTLRALGDLASFYRKKFNIPVVGITGSVGKTSTKEMVAAVLSQQYRVMKTEGNFNNEIGLPLTMFSLDKSHQCAVIEMGMSGFGEISRLSRISQPDIAIITNIGLSHIEKLGSRQNILKAKMEILDGLSRNGVVILNGDDQLLSGMRNLLPYKTIFYGLEDDADYQAFDIKTAGEQGTYFKIEINNKTYEVHIPVPGIHNVHNALAAIAAGIELKVPVEKIIKGIGEYTPAKMRLNILSFNGIKIINDTYNASPQSMEAALGVLKDIEGNRKIAVLGDMLEMGSWADKAHKDVGKFAFESGVELLITVGENGRNIARGALDSGMNPEKVHQCETNEEIVNLLEGLMTNGDVILVKGSRGMKMEEIVERLTAGK